MQIYKKNRSITGWLALAALASFNLQPSTAHGQGTACTYQGQLNDNGSAANGLYDLRLKVWDAPTNGNMVAGPLTTLAAGITNGLFAVTLDFGPGVFTGPGRWLELDVRTNGNGAFTTLLPLQQILPMPYAMMANTASNVLGMLPAEQLSGTLPSSALAGYSGPVAFTNPADSFNGSFSGLFHGDGGGLTNLNETNLPFTLEPRPDPGLRIFSSPPMGYNTWYDMSFSPYYSSITNVAYTFITNGLLAAGFNLIEIDDGWYQIPPLRDTNGFLIADPGKFPYGMRALSDLLHSWGFLLGLYYNWYTAGQSYAVQDAELLANWNIDYIKLDVGNVGPLTNNNWLNTFATVADTLYLSNNRTPLFINAHTVEPSDAPSVHQILNSRFATGDIPDGGYSWLTSGLWYMTNADWYTRAVPCQQLVYRWGRDTYAATNQLMCFQAVASLAIMLSSEYVLSPIFDSPGSSPGRFTNVTRTLSILTNADALRILRDPAQMVSRIAWQAGTAQAWIKPLGSSSHPMEWAVAMINLDQTPGLMTNLTLSLSSYIPQTIRPMTVKEVWSGRSWLVDDALTGTNFVNGEARVYRLTPYYLDRLNQAPGLTTNYTIPGGLTLYITNGLIMRIR